MRLSHTMRIVMPLPALALVLAAAPAMANEGEAINRPPASQPIQAAPQFTPLTMAPGVRETWLSECRARARFHMRKKRAAEYCVNYLDDYLARYNAHHAYYAAYAYQPAPVHIFTPVRTEVIETK